VHRPLRGPANLCQCPLFLFLCASEPKRGLLVFLADFKTVSTKPSHRAAACGRSSKSTPSRHFSDRHRRRRTLSFTHVSGLAAFGSPPSCLSSLDLTLQPCILVLGPYGSRTLLSPLPGLRSSYLGSVLFSLSNSLVRYIPCLHLFNSGIALLPRHRDFPNQSSLSGCHREWIPSSRKQSMHLTKEHLYADGN
jgi:hypothetical protein